MILQNDKRQPVWFWILVMIVVVIFIFPMLWIYITSFKAKEDMFSTDPNKLFLFPPTLANYIHVITQTTLLKEIGTSLIVSFVSTLIVLLISIPAAYSFTRFNTGSGHLLFTTITTRMFPPCVAAIPFFMVFRSLGLIDKHLVLILLYTYFNMSFATFLLYGFFREIPEQMEYAAMVDGYSRLTVLTKIVFPLIRPGVTVTTIFCLVFAWNEFIFALLFTRLNARTVSVGLTGFWASIEVSWGPMSAAIGIAILPTLIVGWLMQKHIIKGLTFGAVKG